MNAKLTIGSNNISKVSNLFLEMPKGSYSYNDFKLNPDGESLFVNINHTTDFSFSDFCNLLADENISIDIEEEQTQESIIDDIRSYLIDCYDNESVFDNLELARAIYFHFATNQNTKTPVFEDLEIDQYIVDQDMKVYGKI